VLRYTDSTHLWTARVHPHDNEIQLYEFDGTATKRASASVTIDGNTAYDIRAIAYGQTIDAFVDGGNKISYGSATVNETETVHGIRCGVGGTPPADATYDNFAIFPRTDATQYDLIFDAY